MKKKTSPVRYANKELQDVTTRDHSESMKADARSILRDGDDATQSSVVQELSVLPGFGSAISVRAAKAHLSGLLDLVAAGREIVVTSGGKPKARLVPMGERPRKVFTGTREHLAKMPKWKEGDLTADEIIREDRDSRG
ncbi:MAG TPA: type II toxin-antitoxin system prevent-host-death family antitoxin [Chthoniobacteraceae bacterium]|jgi:prevent-host-death family protein